MRGHALAVAIAVSVSLAGGFATDASGQLVVRRLSLPASPRTAAATKAPRPNPGPARAALPAALTPQALGTGPAAWARLMEVRAQRQRAMPDFLGRPSTGWSR